MCSKVEMCFLHFFCTDSCKVSCEKPQMIAPLRDCHVSATSTINTKKHDAKVDYSWITLCYGLRFRFYG